MLKERFFCRLPFCVLTLTSSSVRRSGSRASSRSATPGVSARRDYDRFDDAFQGSNNPYDEYGAYDTNYGAGPSRPPPIPYDDPYSDSFTSVPTGGDNMALNRDGPIHQDSIRPGSIGADRVSLSVHADGRNLDLGPRNHNTRGRGRGGGRNRPSDRGRRGRGKPQHSQRHQGFPQRALSHDYSPGLTSPSSFIPPYNQQPGYGGGGGESDYGATLMTQPPPAFGFGLPSTFSGVQPHINPRFANQLGFNFSPVSQTPQISSGMGSPSAAEHYDPGDNLRAADGYNRWEEGGS
jgi:H/ACA ribonucleoprotein complex non-core subunit NAF1